MTEIWKHQVMGNGKFPKAGTIVSCRMDQRESPVRPSALLGDGREKV